MDGGPPVLEGAGEERGEHVLVARHEVDAVVGEILDASPAARSFRETESTLDFGLSRSAHCARRCLAGSTTRSPNGSARASRLSSTRPYVDARRTAVRRCRAGVVATSATRNAAPARSVNAKAKSIGYPLKETILRRMRDPNAISVTAVTISMCPVEVL